MDVLFGQVNVRACITLIVICTHHGFRLWHNLVMERFKSEFNLLGYLPTTANEHYQSVKSF